ncbi:helix-turn-helix domain-containing protein [Maribellus sediminis]|uniref:helix-turn-helix domain-containing protein n=1 Tax=Maribellus sediminis TaxID=2696285 RepID=UPI0014309142|nr:helix-turn-helix domain-containing protein [Maribellus sediminis]
MQAVTIVQITIDELEERISKAVQSSLKTPKEAEEFIPRKELAAKLGVTLPTIDQWRREGRIKAYAIDRKVYFKRSEIEQAMKPV